MKELQVLVACEESQAVCKAFREKGHIAFSCDLEKCSGEHPEWHINSDVLPLLNGRCGFTTEDGHYYNIDCKWDLIIAHPPCTHLAVSGARHFEKKRATGVQLEAVEFFVKILDADCYHIAIENPVGIISGNYLLQYWPDKCKYEWGLPLKPTQIIQPFEYGHNARKTTCLWLKNLPKLKPTKIVEPKIVTYVCNSGKIVTFSDDYVHNLQEGRSTKRSKTYPGIAQAMAEQWGNYLQVK